MVHRSDRGLAEVLHHLILVKLVFEALRLHDSVHHGMAVSLLRKVERQFFFVCKSDADGIDHEAV